MTRKFKSLLLLSVFGFCTSLQAQYYEETPVFIPYPDPDENWDIRELGPTGIALRLEPTNFTMRVTGVIAGSPADLSGNIHADQIIESINGVVLEKRDPRVILGDIITQAEATDGVLTLQVRDEGPVTINIPVLGQYSATWPLNCPKSDNIVSNLAERIAAQAQPNWGSIIFLLSTGDDAYLPVIGDWIENMGSLGTYPWHYGMAGLGVCEYYLRTGDTRAIPLIQEGADTLRDLLYAGGWSGRGHASITYSTGSGHLNAAGVPATTFLLLAKLCGVVNVDEHTLQASLKNFYRFVAHDNVGYGQSWPEGGFRDNGKTSALAFTMQAAARLDPAGESSIYAKARDISATKAFYATSWFNRGHTGGGIGEMWRGMAIGFMADKRPEQYRDFMDSRRWHWEISRYHTGGMGINDGERYDKTTGTANDWGTFYALAYTLPRKNLILSGAPLTEFCVPYDLPERPWGTAADETFFSLTAATQPGGEVTDLSVERLGTHDSASYTSGMTAPEVTDADLMVLAHHIDHGIRTATARNIVAKGFNHLLVPLLQSDDPRVRHAGLLTITGMFKGSAFSINDISQQAIQEVESILEDPNESLWVKIHAAKALSRFSAATIAAHKTTLLAMLQHDDWWVQDAGGEALRVIVAESDHYQELIPPLAEFSTEIGVVNLLWGYAYYQSDMMKDLQAAPAPIRDLAAQHFVQGHASTPVIMQGPGGHVVTIGATYINDYLGQGADYMLGSDPFPRAMTLSTSTYRKTLNEDDRFDYDGYFTYDAGMATTWEYATRLNTADSLGDVLDGIETGPNPPSSTPDITFNNDGTIEGDPGAAWTQGVYIDLFKREAREVLQRQHNGQYYLLIEIGTFDNSPPNPNQYWHPGYDAYVRKYDDLTAPTPDPMRFKLTPTGIDSTTVSMVAATAIDGSYPVEYYFENTTNSNFRDWSTDPLWNNTGLAAGTYGYRVKARDGEGNETVWSDVVNGSPGDDSSPPYPDPMTFARPPTAKAADSITMTATTALDFNGVEYYFACTDGGGPDSGWKDVPVFTPTGLTTGVPYTYVARARDKSAAQNTTADSSPAAAAPAAVTDVTPPLVALLAPANGATGVATAASLVLTFDEEVAAGTGSIIVRNLTESIDTSIPVADGQVVISGTTVTITPTGGLIEGRTYAIRMAEGVLTDLAANGFEGIINDTTWSFTIADSNPPLVHSLSPADNAIEVSPSRDLLITFDEPVAVGTGNVTIKNLTDATQTQIDITDGSQVTVSGSILTLNPTGLLGIGKQYAVHIDATAIDDLAGNSFAGIADDTSWSFTTWLNPILPPEHPLVPTSIDPGETFQLAFVSSAVLQRDLLDGVNDGSDDSVISQWNAWANDQAAANTHATAQKDIAAISWYAIASTKDVAAKDNAVVSGPVYRIDRNQVATNATDMWDASLINGISVDENGVSQSGNVWAGGPSYQSDGTIGGQPLGNGTASASRGNTGNDHTWFGQGGHIARGPDDTSTRVFALSEAITVDASVDTPPVVSIMSPVDGASSVAVGTDLVLTFNEAIAAGTGVVTIKNLTDSTQSTIDITDGTQVTLSGVTLTISPSAALAFEKDYAIQISPTAVEDLTGNAFAGITDDTTWNFATASGEPAVVTAPASDVGSSTATLNGTLTSTGGAPTVVYALWGDNDAGEVRSSWDGEIDLGTNTSGVPLAYVTNLTGLVGGTTYYYRFYATNAFADSWGAVQSFTPVLPPPPVPTGLSATAGDGQVALNWAAVAEADSYNVKRAAGTGGPYTTIDSTTNASYTDTGLVNGSNYYYVVSAVNAGGESADSDEASAMPVFMVPFYEPFDDRTPGDLNGQYGWDSTSTLVQGDTTFGGSALAGQVSGGDGYARHTFSNGPNRVWVDQRVQITYGEEPPSPTAEHSVAFYVATNGMVMAFDGATPVATGQAVDEGQWVRFTLFSDYTTATWKLYVDGQPAGRYGFYSPSVAVFSEWSVRGGTTVDDLTITLERPDLAWPDTLIIVR